MLSLDGRKQRARYAGPPSIIERGTVANTLAWRDVDVPNR
jgi:hypothetical protein